MVFEIGKKDPARKAVASHRERVKARTRVGGINQVKVVCGVQSRQFIDETRTVGVREQSHFISLAEHCRVTIRFNADELDVNITQSQRPTKVEAGVIPRVDNGDTAPHARYSPASGKP